MEFTDPILGWSDPGTLWTTANVDEAAPDVLSPLCWSVWGYGLEHGRVRSQYKLGLLTDDENHVSDDPSHRASFVFYGRQAANVDELRRILGRLPGVTPDDIERDWFGIERDNGPDVPPMPEREPYIMECFAREAAQQHARLELLRSAQTSWWQRDVFDAGRGDAVAQGTPLERLHEARRRFTEAFYVHTFTRYFMPGPTVAIMTAATGTGSPELAGALLSGYGNMEETSMADALWRIGHGELDLAAFLRTYGFHGPNEGNVYTRSWRDEPQRAGEIAAQYSQRRDLARPRDRVTEIVAARREAERRLLAALPEPDRPELEAKLRTLETLTRDLEVGKALYLMGLDGCRAAARDLGRELVNRGLLGEVDDVFFLSVDELDELGRVGLAAAAEMIASRREQRARYARMRLPKVFTGMPVPIVIDDGEAPAPASHLTGTAAGGARVEGRARVVLAASDNVIVEEGDILVCRMTDPGWAALMALAAAVVTDIGNASSHGAVVAREFGIPYVVGTGNGTTVIPDRATIVVDGQAGMVEFKP